MRLLKKAGMSALALLAMAAVALPGHQANAQTKTTADHVVINEIAWMGTTTSYNDEWVELYNPTARGVSVDGWRLATADGTPDVTLSGTIEAQGFYILERTSDGTLPDTAADKIYAGALVNAGEDLRLANASGTVIDEVDQWYAGDNDAKATMARVSASAPGTDGASWRTAITAYGGGYGTPEAVTPNEGAADSGPGSIAVYFNKAVDTSVAADGNEANGNVNLAEKLIARIHAATESVDAAIYEINLPNVVQALIAKAAEGVPVRMIVDAKETEDSGHVERYKLMRVYLEQLVRGADGEVGTADDVHVFADSPIFAVEDASFRQQYGLAASGYKDFPRKTVDVGEHTSSGYFMVDAEQKADGGYYSPGEQMHNKFAVIDDEEVWTGSWNWTTTGLYGSEANREAGILGGNSQNVVDIVSEPLATVYETEYSEMWGSRALTPNPAMANFNDRKTDNTKHTVYVNDTKIDVYFSGGDDAIGHVTDYIQASADESAHFCIFAWSDQSMVNALKVKWEGSAEDNVGTRTGFEVKGVFDEIFWNQWWSASVDMTGRTASDTSENNPNIRWNHPAPVYEDNEDRKLHDKYMIIDAGTSSDPTVITGSTNWSTNGNTNNDENMLFIHNGRIANQYEQDFYQRYETAGGTDAHSFWERLWHALKKIVGMGN
ncbi:MAG TPA: phospholipase D-like domain-containing protein [Bacillales bacterium]|nr:phospholipase D-like domain-containing protein [Bacillales bacterium]